MVWFLLLFWFCCLLEYFLYGCIVEVGVIGYWVLLGWLLLLLWYWCCLVVFDVFVIGGGMCCSWYGCVFFWVFVVDFLYDEICKDMYLMLLIFFVIGYFLGVIGVCFLLMLCLVFDGLCLLWFGFGICWWFVWLVLCCLFLFLWIWWFVYCWCWVFLWWFDGFFLWMCGWLCVWFFLLYVVMWLLMLFVWWV